MVLSLRQMLRDIRGQKLRTTLTVLGIVWGTVAVSLLLYGAAGEATRLPLEMSLQMGGLVLLLTVSMCALSGIIALRKIRSADPAEIF